MIWNKQFGSPANDHINKLYLEEDGSLLGIGIYGATDTTAGQGWMLSVGADGKKQWMKLLTDMYPISSLKSGKNILVGGHMTDSLKSMYLVKYDSEADKLYTRTYSLPGSIRAINPHSTDGQIFSGKNWVVHIDELGYIQQDEILDSNLVVLDVFEKEGVIYAAGINDDFNLFLWDSQNKNVTQTTQNVKKLKYLPSSNILVLGSNNSLMELTNAGGFVKDVAKYADDFTMKDNFLFFSSVGSILESNITIIKYK
jgi:WD40 repeat protein